MPHIDIHVVSEKLLKLKQTQVAVHLTLDHRGRQAHIMTDPSLFFPARWVVCVSCLQSHLCAAAGRLMARSAVGGASVTAVSASARPQTLRSSMGRIASATTGSVLRIMGKPATVRTVI